MLGCCLAYYKIYQYKYICDRRQRDMNEWKKMIVAWCVRKQTSREIPYQTNHLMIDGIGIYDGITRHSDSLSIQRMTRALKWNQKPMRWESKQNRYKRMKWKPEREMKIERWRIERKRRLQTEQMFRLIKIHERRVIVSPVPASTRFLL